MKRGEKNKIKQLEEKLRITEGNLFIINLGNRFDKHLYKHKYSEYLTTNRIKLQIHKECVEHLENIIYLQEQIEKYFNKDQE